MSNKRPISIIDKLTFMCTHCFDVYTVKIPDIEYDSNQLRFEVYSDKFKPENCPCCGMKNSMVYIDKDIVYYIQSLNKKGYITTFCCAGHLNGSYATEPYIRFGPDIKIDKLKPLRSSWYFDDDIAYGSVIRAKLNGEMFPYSISLETDDDINDWLSEHFAVLDDLGEWVSSLPQNKDYDDLDVHVISTDNEFNTLIFMYHNRIYGVFHGGYLYRIALDSYGGESSAELILNEPELTEKIFSEMMVWCSREEALVDFVSHTSELFNRIATDGGNNEKVSDDYK